MHQTFIANFWVLRHGPPVGLPKPTTVGNLRDTGHSVGATPLAAMAEEATVKNPAPTFTSQIGYHAG